MGPKRRLILTTPTSVGHTTYRVDLESCDESFDLRVRINYRQMLDFAGRQRHQKLRIGLAPDRILLWANQTTYVLAPVQDDSDTEN